MKSENIREITREIEKVLERGLRAQLLRERESQLNRELAAVRRDIWNLSGARPSPVRAPIAEPVAAPVEARATRTAARPKPGQPSVRAMLVDTLKRTGRPMTVKELTAAVERRGFKSTRRHPYKTVDSSLRINRHLFRRTAPSTFGLTPTR